MRAQRQIWKGIIIASLFGSHGLGIPIPVWGESTPAPLPQDCPVSPESEKYWIKRIEVVGNTILQAEIQALIEPLENRQLSFEELICLRSAISQLYIDRGYITSGAFLPNQQDISDGVVKIQVIEGRLERMEITGLQRLQENYIRSRLERVTGQPLNQQALQDGLALLQLAPLLSQINAELTAGSGPGQSVLLVTVKEAPAFHASIGADNYRPPSIGSEELTFTLSHDNLVGWGDRLAGEYALTEGLGLYNVAYTVPINAMNGTVGFAYYNTETEITESIFQAFQIRNQTETFSFQYRQPVYRSPATEWALGLNLDLRRNQSSLEDIPFCFSLPCSNGATNLTVLRFYQEWLNRDPSNVLAARSQFSFGLSALDATVSDIEPNGQFFSWLGQFQWLNRLNSADWLLLTRFYAQLSPDALPIIEQFSLGGIDTVRGYGQNQLVTDNAVLASVELRIPLTADPSVLQLTPFIEGGTGWNNVLPNPDPSTLIGTGLGLRWRVTPSLALRLDYGIPLVSLNNRGNTLQEQGFYFSLRYQPF
ncbi:ShlB/FhaC/HecB family hemolysin secretion/activation protein [Synechocystis sp. LKSZ1]|uniref:ShlB/FhaC/HecB family hemolysin secretion/activation protein n=1 Tax=Synechocystis sp. LKSZ1 TaxID=3144951 RepID=UPI00336BE34F